MSSIVGVQTVGAEGCAVCLQLGANRAGSVQVTYGQGVVFGCLTDDVYVVTQNGGLGDAAVARGAGLGHVLIPAVQRSDYHDGAGGVFYNQFREQIVARTPEGLGGAVVGRAKQSLSVTEIVGTAKNHNGVSHLGHLINARCKICVKFGNCMGGIAVGKASAADTEVIRLGKSVLLLDELMIHLIGCAGAVTLCDAVA